LIPSWRTTTCEPQRISKDERQRAEILKRQLLAEKKIE